MSGQAALAVRPLRPDEHQVVGRLTVAAYAAFTDHPLEEGYADLLADVGRRAAEAVVLVAVDDDDRPLGDVTYVPDADSPWAEQLQPGEVGIRMLAVDPAAQGRGAGRALVEACIERARDERASAVFLHSTPWMQVAHGLYRQLGFVRTPERDWVPLPEVSLLAFRMELQPG